LMKLDTDIGDTPACRATSRMVTVDRLLGLFIGKHALAFLGSSGH
jgi:hypothetical protein